MTVRKRTGIGENGGLQHILEYDEPQFDYDVIVIRHDPDDEQLVYCEAYIEDDIEYRNAYRIRDIVFDPVSTLGRGESAKLLGVSDTDALADTQRRETPTAVSTAFNSVGMALVPDGRWWLNEQ